MIVHSKRFWLAALCPMLAAGVGVLMMATSDDDTVSEGWRLIGVSFVWALFWVVATFVVALIVGNIGAIVTR